MNFQKPRTAVTTANRRNRHKRISSQPVIKELSLPRKYESAETSPRETPGMTLPSSRQTKVDCSKLFSNDLFKINGICGNKAIMATTSPCLFNTLRSKSRLKTSGRLRRVRVKYNS